jgi:hydroxymethylbilane synthase
MLEIEKIRLGTRGSPLAMWQANWIKDQLEETHEGLKIELVKITTTGDKIQDVPLAKIGGKGLFLKEIEDALLKNKIDIAVHSMKDVPVHLPRRLCIASFTERQDPRDALISKNGIKLADMPQKARIGTGSMRRQTQLLNYRPDLEIVPLRGNIDTRIKKLETEELDGIILAAAGLIRMGWADKITEYIDIDILLPAIGQGSVGIEARNFDIDVLEAIVALDHEETNYALEAERGFLRVLNGGCQVPIGGYATIQDGQLTIRGLVGDLAGKEIIKSEKTGSVEDAEYIGIDLGKEILGMGADKILKEVYDS